MNWSQAIEINRAALLRIVAGLVAIVGLGQGAVLRLPAFQYDIATGLLRRTESAVRRLIVMAARGIEVEPAPRRAWPEGLVLARRPDGAARRTMAFRLYDTRKRISIDDAPEAMTITGPRIRFVGFDPRIPLFRPPPPKRPSALEDIDATRLYRRLDAVKSALDRLPAQARRMARWIRRQAQKPQPLFLSPLRPGKPPGHRDRGRDDVDLVLKECHALARYALADSS
jgi:hypothetical protein